MPMNRRTVLGASMALALTANAWAQKGGARKIVLGQSVPLTGAASEIGLAFAAGAKLYVDNFNSQKNGPGYTFELRQLDDGYVPQKAGEKAKKLLADGAEVLFGFVGTGSSEAGAEVATKEGAIFFAPVAAAAHLRDAKHARGFPAPP